MDEAGRRHPFDMLDEAVERAPRFHQFRHFLRPYLGNSARQVAVRDLCPLRDALLFQPCVKRSNIGKFGQPLPQPATGILDVLLDLTLFPTRCRIAELRLEQIVARHCRKGAR